jgi:hypothetical protein
MVFRFDGLHFFIRAASKDFSQDIFVRSSSIAGPIQ